jgi:hypothetical protein
MIIGIIVSLAVLFFTFFIGISMILYAKPNSNLAATLELNLLMLQIETKIIDLDKINDQEYINIGRKFVSLIIAVGEVKSEREHYFRNRFLRAPKTLDEMVKTIMDKENNMFGWKLLPMGKMAFHMQGKDGAYNLKFISSDGHFEAVYNKDGILLTEENDPINMGTFNYAHQLSDEITHYKYDVQPYFNWNNTKEAFEIIKNKKVEQPEEVDEAQVRHNEYYNLLKNYE